MSDHPVPTPLRAAAGLAALALDEARRLPNRLVTLPVVAVSTAMQASLKIQQGYTELAVRGDQLLAQLRHGSAEETPAWARFDEDEGGAEAGAAGGFGEDHYGEPEPGPGPGPEPDLEPVGADAVTATVPGPAMLPLANYDDLSIPQLRARLRGLTADEVELLVAHEHATGNRAPYVTMLENRLAVLRAS